MGTTTRNSLTAERWQPRESKKRLRELERQAKEQAKLSAIEQARLEVQTYESGLEVLLSVHKEQSHVLNWRAIAVALAPHPPPKLTLHEFHANLDAQRPGRNESFPSEIIEQAKSKDEQDYRHQFEAYSIKKLEWERLRTLARRILEGDPKAYIEALAQFSGLAEISDLGSEIHFAVHSRTVLECGLKVNGVQAIPAETKSLTASGKLSVKPMAKARFQEVYQDYVCSCVLRVAREVFALLPIETVIITASIEAVDSTTGRTEIRPVLSVAILREAFSHLQFETLDPSDSIETFFHRGDVKASRKSGEFERVTPITPVDLPQEPAKSDFTGLFTLSKQLRKQIQDQLADLRMAKARIFTSTPATI